jgi:hypothetical protein
MDNNSATSGSAAAWERPSLACIRDRFRGCLMGGAVGDALGAPVEFLSRAEFCRRFGPEGVTGYAVPAGHVAWITDPQGVLLAVNRDGESDSRREPARRHVRRKCRPGRMLEGLELREVIAEMAEDLFLVPRHPEGDEAMRTSIRLDPIPGRFARAWRQSGECPPGMKCSTQDS